MEIQKNTAAVVLAGGSGSRMKCGTKKQYMEIQGRPLIFYALSAFQKSPVEKIVLVVSPGDESYCKSEIVDKFGLHKVCAVTAGGPERYHSVYNGLKMLEDVDWVLIHDGARPFISQDIITRTLDCVRQYHACVAGMPTKDTVKIADSKGFVESTPRRSLVWNVQTPQAFDFSLVYNAYQKIFLHEDEFEITDDAMVVECMTGHPIKLLEGSYANIKVTTPEDLAGIEQYQFEL